MKCNTEHPYCSRVWKCPVCGSKDQFYIDEPDQEANPECPKLHKWDTVVCDSCGTCWTGHQVSRTMMNKDSMKTCPTCKDKGVIKK